MFVEGSIVLVVDAGNTSVKYTAFENDQVSWVMRDASDIDMKIFSPQKIYFASVRSREHSMLIYTDLKKRFPLSQVCVMETQASACGVTNAYLEPDRLGVDRWLGVVAAHHLMKEGAVVVDAGTAIKVDVVDGDGLHLGGYIAPGLALMENALLSKGARIQYQADEVVLGQGLPNSTARAVTEGCSEMALGFLERVYNRYSGLKWIATGGDAQMLLDALGISMEYQPDLVAMGAKLVGDELDGGCI